MKVLQFDDEEWIKTVLFVERYNMHKTCHAKKERRVILEGTISPKQLENNQTNNSRISKTGTKYLPKCNHLTHTKRSV